MAPTPLCFGKQEPKLADSITHHPGTAQVPLTVPQHPGPMVPTESMVTRLLQTVPRCSHGAAEIVLHLNHLARSCLKRRGKKPSMFSDTSPVPDGPGEGSGLSPPSSSWRTFGARGAVQSQAPKLTPPALG